MTELHDLCLSAHAQMGFNIKLNYEPFDPPFSQRFVVFSIMERKESVSNLNSKMNDTI